VEGIDPALPGFGPFGTCGYHCFDPGYPAYLRIAALAALRREYPALRHGRQYYRQIRNPDSDCPFSYGGAGSIAAWSRILDDEEILCVLNTNGEEERSAEIIVDNSLNPDGSVMEVILNSDEAVDPVGYRGKAPGKNARIGISRAQHGASVVVRALAPSSVIVLSNHARAEEGRVFA
jgi:hypothetical protein